MILYDVLIIVALFFIALILAIISKENDVIYFIFLFCIIGIMFYLMGVVEAKIGVILMFMLSLSMYYLLNKRSRIENE
jgi:cell division protein FtsW (lipid II flippase)